LSYKKNLSYITTALKVLAVITLLMTILITVLTLTFQGAQVRTQQNPAFVIFNTTFPVLLGLLKALILYAIAEFIELMLDIKNDLAEIKD